MKNLLDITLRRAVTGLIFVSTMALSALLHAGDNDHDDENGPEPIVKCNRGDDLQAAIDAAVDGDVITIGGTCIGPFVVSSFNAANDLTIQGNPRASLDGNGMGPVVSVQDRRVVIADLTVKGGFSSGRFATGGIEVLSSDVMLIDVNVTDNHAVGAEVAAGGIYLEFGSLAIVKSKIMGNTAFTSGSSDAFAYGGIESIFEGVLTIDRSSIRDNHASAVGTDGLSEAVGGIHQAIRGSANITDVVVADNSASASATGIGIANGGIGAVSTGEVTIVGTRVTRNDAIGTHVASGGIESFGSGLFTLRDSKIRKNRAEADWAVGGLELNRTDAILADSSVKRNMAVGDLAVGGVDVADETSLVIVDDLEVKKNVPIDCLGLVCQGGDNNDDGE